MYYFSDRPLHPLTPEILIKLAQTKKDLYRCFVLSITDKCNIACDFCCHPYQETGITDEEARDLVSQAAELDFDEICFTGGEPFIRRSALLEAANICRSKGKAFGVISNGYWAGTRQKADRVIGQLAEAGLVRITISWDPSHGAFVPVRTAQNALDASVARGLKVTLTGSFKGKGDSHEKYGFQLGELRKWKNFSDISHSVDPAGNGAGLQDVPFTSGEDLSKTAMACPSRRVLELVCYAANDTLVQPCCSTFAGYKMETLRIGSWRRQSVEELLSAQESDPFFLILRNGGFRRIYEIARERNREIYDRLPKYGDASSTCHMCSKIMSSDLGPEVKKMLNDHLTEKLFEHRNLIDMN